MSLKTAIRNRNRTAQKHKYGDIETLRHWSKNVFHELFYSDLNTALKDGMRILDENRVDIQSREKYTRDRL